MLILTQNSGIRSASLQLGRSGLVAGYFTLALLLAPTAMAANTDASLEQSLLSLKGEATTMATEAFTLVADKGKAAEYRKYADYFKKKAAQNLANANKYKKGSAKYKKFYKQYSFFTEKFNSAYGKYVKHAGGSAVAATAAAASGKNAAAASVASSNPDAAEKYKKYADYFRKKADQNLDKAKKYKKGSADYNKYYKQYTYFMSKYNSAYGKYQKHAGSAEAKPEPVSTSPASTARAAASTGSGDPAKAAQYKKYADYFAKMAEKNRDLANRYAKGSTLYNKYYKLFEYYTDKYASAYSKYLAHAGSSTGSGTGGSGSTDQVKAETIPGDGSVVKDGGSSDSSSGDSGGKVIAVRSQADFDAAINKAAPGHRIVVYPGSYNFPELDKSGTASNPIVIEASVPAVSGGKSHIRNRLIMKGNHIVIRGLDFTYKGYMHDAIFIFKSSHVRIEKNIIRRDDTGYGVRIHNSSDMTIEYNLFDGQFNHAVSSKELVRNMKVRYNTFRDCGAGCVESGQTPDGSLGAEQTSQNIEISNNRFIGEDSGGKRGNRGIGIKIKNAEYTLVRDNVFTGKWNYPIQTSFGSVGVGNKKVLGHLGPRDPKKIDFVGNDFGTTGTLDLSGRGIKGDLFDLRNNKGKTGCRIGEFKTHGSLIIARINWATIYKGKPRISQSGNSFNCS